MQARASPVSCVAAAPPSPIRPMTPSNPCSTRADLPSRDNPSLLLDDTTNLPCSSVHKKEKKKTRGAQPVTKSQAAPKSESLPPICSVAVVPKTRASSPIDPVDHKAESCPDFQAATSKPPPARAAALLPTTTPWCSISLLPTWGWLLLQLKKEKQKTGN